MTDTITILTSATNNYLSKAFSGEQYDPFAFKPGSTFKTSEVKVADLQELAAVLRSLEELPTKTIIRGSPITDATEVVSRTKEQFCSAKRQWCMIDIDSLEWNGEAVSATPPFALTADLKHCLGECPVFSSDHKVTLINAQIRTAFGTTFIF